VGSKPDLVLLHLDEHNLCELETIEAWRRVIPDQKIAVISQVSDVSIVVRAMRLGAVDYIIGPREGQDFLEEIERLLADCAQELDDFDACREACKHFEHVEKRHLISGRKSGHAQNSRPGCAGIEPKHLIIQAQHGDDRLKG